MGKIKYCCYMLHQVSCNKNLPAYLLFIFVKRQIQLTSNTKIQNISKYYIWFTFIDRR